MKRHAIASLDNHFRTHDNHSRSHTNNCAFIKFITRKYIFNNITCFEFHGSVIILRLLRHLTPREVGLHKTIPMCTFTSSYCGDVLFQCFEEQLGAVNSQSDPSISCFISVIRALLDLWTRNICLDGRFQRADRLFGDIEKWAVRWQHFELRVRTQLVRTAMCRGSIVNEYDAR